MSSLRRTLSTLPGPPVLQSRARQQAVVPSAPSPAAASLHLPVIPSPSRNVGPPPPSVEQAVLPATPAVVPADGDCGGFPGAQALPDPRAARLPLTYQRDLHNLILLRTAGKNEPSPISGHSEPPPGMVPSPLETIAPEPPSVEQAVLPATPAVVPAAGGCRGLLPLASSPGLPLVRTPSASPRLPVTPSCLIRTGAPSPGRNMRPAPSPASSPLDSPLPDGFPHYPQPATGGVSETRAPPGSCAQCAVPGERPRPVVTQPHPPLPCGSARPLEIGVN